MFGASGELNASDEQAQQRNRYGDKIWFWATEIKRNKQFEFGANYVSVYLSICHMLSL